MQTAATPDISDNSLGFSFDTFELQRSLVRSGACGGLRRATSAPHSMDSLGWEPSVMAAGALRGSTTHNANYQPPTGGPMRRVGSSLGLRRSSSFFWTPEAHREFERAIATLSTRGVEVSAGNILGEMSRMQTAELKLSDVDKHLRKKLLVQRRVLQQLELPAGGNGGGGAPAAERPSASQQSGDSTGLNIRLAAVPGLSRGPSSSMSSVAEEPSAPAQQSAASPANASSPAATAAAAQALSDSLAQQLQAQRYEHLTLAAAREAMVAGAEGRAAQQA